MARRRTRRTSRRSRKGGIKGIHILGAGVLLWIFWPKGASASEGEESATTSPSITTDEEAEAGVSSSTGGTHYTVKAGDSLSKIALALYGNMSRWPEIYAANRDQISDPNLIYPGQRLLIP